MRKIETTDQPVETSEHKTGRYYDVFIFVERDQRRYLWKMKEAFIAETGREPSYIFASMNDKPETTISSNIRQVFCDQFGDDPDQVIFILLTQNLNLNQHQLRIDSGRIQSEMFLPFLSLKIIKLSKKYC